MNTPTIKQSNCNYWPVIQSRSLAGLIQTPEALNGIGADVPSHGFRSASPPSLGMQRLSETALPSELLGTSPRQSNVPMPDVHDQPPQTHGFLTHPFPGIQSLFLSDPVVARLESFHGAQLQPEHVMYSQFHVQPEQLMHVRTMDNMCGGQGEGSRIMPQYSSPDLLFPTGQEHRGPAPFANPFPHLLRKGDMDSQFCQDASPQPSSQEAEIQVQALQNRENEHKTDQKQNAAGTSNTTEKQAFVTDMSPTTSAMSSVSVHPSPSTEDLKTTDDLNSAARPKEQVVPITASAHAIDQPLTHGCNQRGAIPPFPIRTPVVETTPTSKTTANVEQRQTALAVSLSGCTKRLTYAESVRLGMRRRRVQPLDQHSEATHNRRDTRQLPPQQQIRGFQQSAHPSHPEQSALMDSVTSARTLLKGQQQKTQKMPDTPRKSQDVSHVNFAPERRLSLQQKDDIPQNKMPQEPTNLQQTSDTLRVSNVATNSSRRQKTSGDVQQSAATAQLSYQKPNDGEDTSHIMLSTTRTARLQEVLTALTDAEVQVRTEVAAVTHAQELAAAAQRALEDASSRVRVLSLELQAAQTSINQAAACAHSAQTHLAAREHLLAEARQHAEAVAAEVTQLDSANVQESVREGSSHIAQHRVQPRADAGPPPPFPRVFVQPPPGAFRSQLCQSRSSTNQQQPSPTIATTARPSMNQDAVESQETADIGQQMLTVEQTAVTATADLSELKQCHEQGTQVTLYNVTSRDTISSPVHGGRLEEDTDQNLADQGVYNLQPITHVPYQETNLEGTQDSTGVTQSIQVVGKETFSSAACAGNLEVLRNKDHGESFYSSSEISANQQTAANTCLPSETLDHPVASAISASIGEKFHHTLTDEPLAETSDHPTTFGEWATESDDSAK